ncbi:MAG: oligosaccharide flippase family protein [Flectobacillus sp.]|nr:oligosaccharide flippase family protein [Flectobacillus sp.]
MFYKKIGQYKSVVSNLSYLTVLQLFNLILPLLSYPYLIRTLGKDNWGMLVYIQTITGYLAVIVNFGFNVTGTRDISLNVNNIVERNKIGTTIYLTKAVLFVGSLCVVFMYLLITSSDILTLKLTILSSWNVLYEFAVPIWFFQGLNKMKYVTIINVIAKTLVTASVFIFIHKTSDVILYPLLNLFFTFLSVLLCYLILRKEGFQIGKTSLLEVKKLVRESYIMALAYISNAFKANSNIVLLKFLLSYKEIAYFDLAQKVLNIFTSFLDLISQSIYPMMVRDRNMNFLKKVILYSSLLAVFSTMLTILCSEKIALVLGGVEMLYSQNIINVLSFNYLPYIVGALLGRNCLLVFKKDGEVLKSMFYSSIIYLLLVGMVVYFIRTNLLEWFAGCLVCSFLYETAYRYIKARELLFVK